MATMFPVTCAVKMLRLTNPIRSTKPAITLSKVRSHASDRKGIAAVCEASTAVYTAMGPIADTTDSFIPRNFVNFHSANNIVGREMAIAISDTDFRVQSLLASTSTTRGRYRCFRI